MKAIGVIAVVGGKHSGKTTTAQALINGLVKKGYKVAAVKHVHEPKFTIDTEGKDTWLFAKAGAQTIISVAPNEIAIIKKVNTESCGLNDILKECGDACIIVIEGFTKLVMKEPYVLKVVAAKNASEIDEAAKLFNPIIAFTGPIATKHEHERLSIPYIDVLKNPERLVELVESELQKKRGSLG